MSALNNEAVIVTDWYRNNFLLANKDKFQAIFLAPRAKDTSETRVTVDHEEIECLNFLKLLGVVLDNKLNFRDYVKLMCSKANSKTGVLARMRKLVQGRPSCFFSNLSSWVELLFNCMVMHKSIRQAQIEKNARETGNCERYLRTIHQVTRPC